MICSSCLSEQGDLGRFRSCERCRAVRRDYSRRYNAEGRAHLIHRLAASRLKAKRRRAAIDPRGPRLSPPLGPVEIQRRLVNGTKTAAWKAGRLGLTEHHSTEEWLDLVSTHPNCTYCSTPLTTATAVRDHSTPLRKGGTNSIDNIGVTCSRCNHQKRGRTHAEYLDWLRTICPTCGKLL